MKMVRIFSVAYAAVCLAIAIAEMLFHGAAANKLSSIWDGTGAISDPVVRFFCYLLISTVVAGLLPGIIVSVLALLAFAIGGLVVSLILKAAMWLVALSAGGAVLVALVVIVPLVVLLYSNRDRVIEAIARVFMTISWLLGFSKGEDLYGRPASPVSRIGGILVLCGIISLMIGLRHQTPRWLSNIGRAEPPVRAVAQGNTQGQQVAKNRSTKRRRKQSVTNSPAAPPTREKEMRALLDEVQQSRGIPPASAQSTNRQDVYRIGGGISAPTVLYKVNPDYSPEARKARLSGKVLVQVVIDQSGAARNIKVVKSLGLGLDEKAVEAVEKWKFTPGMKDGKPVATRATIEINFQLV